MFRRVGLVSLAILSGVFLALMINVNATLAESTSAFQASWIAHGVGGVFALLLYLAFEHRRDKPEGHSVGKRYWFGGIPGALTVVLASLTVPSDIGLTGTLSLALIGQFMLSLVIEHFAWLDQPKNKLSFSNVLPTLLVALGSVLIIYGKVKL